MSRIPVLANGPVRARHRLVLAHGAGAPMDSPFMDAIAEGLAAEGIRVIRFEFPYMRGRRDEGTKRPPDREPVLRETWRQVVEEQGGGARLVIGGKSMGGRIATLVADELGVRGVVCLGYPFHPPARPDKLRVEHLKRLRAPTLVVQGTRDPFGTKAEARTYRLPKSIRLAWLDEGDHSFVPPRRSAHTEEAHLATAVAEVAAFVRSLAG